MANKSIDILFIINCFGGLGPSLMPYNNKVNIFLLFLLLYAGDRVVDNGMEPRKYEAL